MITEPPRAKDGILFRIWMSLWLAALYVGLIFVRSSGHNSLNSLSVYTFRKSIFSDSRVDESLRGERQRKRNEEMEGGEYDWSRV